jgi:alkylation response protein AidB-like acyl-CoA dehydrogenase
MLADMAINLEMARLVTYRVNKQKIFFNEKKIF